MAQGLIQLQRKKTLDLWVKTGGRCISLYVCVTISFDSSLPLPLQKNPHDSYQSSLFSDHVREKVLQPGPAEQTVCIKTACVVLSLTPERGRERKVTEEGRRGGGNEGQRETGGERGRANGGKG